MIRNCFSGLLVFPTDTPERLVNVHPNGVSKRILINRWFPCVVLPKGTLMQGFIYYIIRSPILAVHSKFYRIGSISSTFFYAEG